MAAAPGSKTTQMAAMMNNEGYILANEIDKFRCEKLKYNVEKQGASIVHIINKDGTQLNNSAKSFDKILVDAPCSGEGRFIVSNKKTYEHWSLKMQKELVEIQKKLLSNAINLCKINGTILYSTCALSLAENEKVCIEKNTRVKLNDKLSQTSKLDINLTNKSETNLNEEKEFVSYNSWVTKGNKKGLNDEIKNTIKILPNKLLEGFYVAKIKKLRIITAKNKKATDKVTSVAWNSNDENQRYKSQYYNKQYYV